jgi:hypothetical protein
VRSRRVRTVALLTVLALAAFVARATAAVDMGGHPLHVFATQGSDSTGPGGFQARFDGLTDGQFAPSTSNATPAGLHVAVYNFPSSGQTSLFGPTSNALPQSTAFTLSSGPTLSGTGSANNPLELHTVYSAGGSGLEVTEDLAYQNGGNGFHASYLVTNNSGSSRTFRATLAGNAFITGGNGGYGVFESGPRLVSAINDVLGDGVALQDSPPTPFAHFQEAEISTIWAAVATPTGPGFNDSVNSAFVNPGVGFQWPDTTLASGGSASFQANVIAGGFNGMTLSPTSAVAVPGDQHTVTATVLNHGNPAPGVQVRYTITGANPSSGVVVSDAAGHANITWTGKALGLDTLAAFPDSNGNGVHETDEVTRTATVLWQLPAPKFGETANLSPISGNVTVHEPDGDTLRLENARQIPIGSTVNLTNGAANLITARGPSGGQQAGKFFGGNFKLLQKKRHRRHHRRTVDLRLVGGKLETCSAGGTKAGAARRHRRRRLWGDASGSYRSVGENSAATVRGTRWLVQDTCAGTLTRVRRGVVVVTDFVHHKTVILKRGQSYLARFG